MCQCANLISQFENVSMCQFLLLIHQLIDTFSHCHIGLLPHWLIFLVVEMILFVIFNMSKTSFSNSSEFG